jgi:DNA-binding transcriptional LysR family regulator
MTTIMEKTAGLVAFVRAAEAGSFTAAAKLTGSTPSAVSKSVARLERRLGVRLFRRSTRTLALTLEGTAYYERVAPLLRGIEDAEDIVQAAETARGLLRVTMPTNLGPPLIGPLTRTFLARHSAVKLELNFTDRHVDLMREGYDIALRIGTLADTELVVRKVAELPITLVASPDYLARTSTPQAPEDLRGHSCLRYILGGRVFPITFADGAVTMPEGPLDTDIGFALRDAAVNGAGIAYLMRFAVKQELADGRLVEILPGMMPIIPIHVLHAFGRQPPVRARLFVDFVAEEIAHLG